MGAAVALSSSATRRMPCCPMPGKAPARLSRTPTSSRAGSRLAPIRSRPLPTSAASASRACMACSGSPCPMLASSTCAIARRRRTRSPPAKAASTATPSVSGVTIPLADGTKSLLFPPLMLREARSIAASIYRDPSRLDQTRPALLRLCQVGRNVLGRGWSRFVAQSRKGLLDLGRGERRGSCLVDLPPDRQWRPRRRDNHIDRGCDQLIETALHHGGNIRRQWAAPFAGHRQGFEPAVTNMRKDLHQRGKEDLNLAAQEAGQCLTAAAIGNMEHIDPGGCFQEFALEMWKRPDAG